MTESDRIKYMRLFFLTDMQNSGHKGQNCSNRKKPKEVQLVRPTEICGKSIKRGKWLKVCNKLMLLSNVIDADHQYSCLFTNKGHFPSPLIGVLAKFHE